MHDINAFAAERGLSRLVDALGIGEELLWPADSLVTGSLAAGERWAGHVPFAWWLVSVLCPAQVVVLGAADGAGCAAFCQAIARLHLPARVFASGAAAPPGRHPPFLTSLAAEPAATQFADGSVDLLYVEGPRPAAALAAILQAWHGRLSRRGVLLCDATNRRDGSTGAWRFWHDATARLPGFEFVHDDGIGALGVGAEQTACLGALFAATRSAADTELIRRLFAARGEALALRAEADAARAERAHLIRSLAEADATGAALATARAALQQAQATVAQRDVEAARREQIVRERDAALALQILSGRQRLDERDAEIARLRASVGHYRNSTSWRLTRPLRAAMTFAQRHARRNAPEHLPALRVMPPPPPPAPSIVVSDAKAAMRAALAARLRVFMASGATLALPTRLRPDISIVLVLHNQAELTFGCLSALVECLGGSDIRAEIIVLDNASTDATQVLLDRIAGASVIRSRENLHYLRGVNRAVEAASGRHLLLLNNDAQVFPGSLEAALNTLDSDAGIGAVGARIVLPDGTLQEAGSIVWSDGSGSGYLRGMDPTSPEAMFRRNVDYCSGAFLLTPRAAFARLGGFDERYAPAYYEETDYCLRLWQQGLRVAYEPDAIILHYEFGSAANAADALAAQQRNQVIFRERHHHWLEGQWPNRPEHLLAARVVPSARKRVLVIEDRVPHVRLGSGYPRARDLLFALAELAEVTLFPAARQTETAAELRTTMPPGVEAMLGCELADLPDFLRQRHGFYDAIIVCRPTNMQPFLSLGGATAALRGDAMLIYDAEAIFANRETLKRMFAGTPLTAGEAAALLHDELALARQADAVLSVSPAEQRQFADNGLPVHLVGLALPVTPTRAGFADRRDILFVGAMHEVDTPNTDGLRWFAEAVLPLLREKLGTSLRLTVIGVNTVPSIAQLDGLAFDLVGPVEDLTPWFERARVFVAPTRFAAGLPHKVAQAAALGVPVVATELLAQQLGWQSGRELLAASEPDAFADACARLFTEQTLWQQIRAAALDACLGDFAPQRFVDAVGTVIQSVPSHHPAPQRALPDAPRDYADWVRRFDTLTHADRRAIGVRVAAMADPPLISVLVPLYDTPEPWLRRCIASVRDQLYPHWELCLVDDASPQPHVAAIAREAAAQDSRIRFVRREANGHIAAATNTALAMARGTFVALLDHDDELADHALYMVAEALAEQQGLDLIFSDEDKIDTGGNRYEPWFKSRWNAELMLAQNAVVHLAVYRRSLLCAIGGFREGFDGSQDYDVVLRFAEQTRPERIRHLPFILYHWRAIPGSLAASADAKTYAYEAAARAIQQHLDRTGSGATVTRQPHPGFYRVLWPLPAPPPATIIVPTRDRADLLRIAVGSLLGRTTYPNFDVLIVDNRSEQAETQTCLAELARHPRVRVVKYDAPYSFAALNNWAVTQTDAPLVALVNNDVDVISADWLTQLAALAVRPEVGAAGAMLYYPDDTIQHAGIAVGIGGLAGHPHVGFPRFTNGYFGRAAVAQQVSAVSGACMVLRRDVFLSIGGFDEANFAVAFNDVDLCLRLQRAGYRVVWTPHAELYHHESASLGRPDRPARQAQWQQECDNLRRIWPEALRDDPFYNPNLTVTAGDFAPAFPPRVIRPWRTR